MNWEDIKKEIRRKPPTKIVGGADQELEEAMSEDNRELIANTRRSTLQAIYRILKDMGEQELVEILEEKLKGME